MKCYDKLMYDDKFKLKLNDTLIVCMSIIEAWAYKNKEYL